MHDSKILKCLHWQPLSSDKEDYDKVAQDGWSEQQLKNYPHKALYEFREVDGLFVAIVFNTFFYGPMVYIIGRKDNVEKLAKHGRFHQEDWSFNQTLGSIEEPYDKAPIIKYLQEIEDYGVGVMDGMMVYGKCCMSYPIHPSTILDDVTEAFNRAKWALK